MNTNNPNKEFKSVNILIINCLCTLVLFFACMTQAHSTKRQLDAHSHGYSGLNVAIEGKTVVLELDSPAFNIVGFEHPPQTDEDKTAIKNGVSKLKNGAELFLFPKIAECQLVDVNIVSSMLDEPHPAHKDHDNDDKDHDQKKSDHDDHSQNNIHSEFQANYKFKCGIIKKVNTIDVMIFKYFPNTRQLNVQTILPNKQSAMELTPTSTLLRF